MSMALPPVALVVGPVAACSASVVSVWGASTEDEVHDLADERIVVGTTRFVADLGPEVPVAGVQDAHGLQRTTWDRFAHMSSRSERASSMSADDSSTSETRVA